MKYRKKPVVIEAERFFSDSLPWPEGVVLSEPIEVPSRAGGTAFIDPAHPIVKTLEGDMAVSEGDWIIRGIRGEYYPCKPDIFEATYEEVKPSEEGKEK